MAAEIQGQATANGLAGLFLQETNDWHAWFYERETILFAIGDANQDQSGIESQVSLGNIAVEAQDNAVVALLGIQSSSETQSVDAISSSAASVSAVQAQSSVKTLEFPKPNDRKIGGQTILRPVQDRDAIAKVKPILAVGLAKKLMAKGSVVQDGSAQVISLRAGSNVSDIYAQGVLDISEDEILLLLAA